MNTYVTHPINQTAVIYGEAGAVIEAPAMKVLAFDENGKFVLPTEESIPIGVALATKVDAAVGDRLDVQIKDICFALASEAVKRGDQLEAGTDGKVKKLASGKWGIGIALSDAAAEKPVEMLIARVPVSGGSGGGSYAPVSHTYKAADITDGTSTFAEKVHTHTKSDITDLDG